MRVGIPKEVKNHEYRVGATPAMCGALIRAGAEVWVETKAGEAIGFLDAHYTEIGAKIVQSAQEAYQADMVIKVKEPQASEIEMMHEDQVIFCFLHLAPDLEQTQGLIKKKVKAIAYETVTDHYGHLPLLAPMSEIAGKLSSYVGAQCLHMSQGGKGVLLGGLPGVLPGNVAVIGGGMAGTSAIKMALGLGASVTVLDTNIERLRQLDHYYGPNLKTLYSNRHNLETILETTDLLIGAVLLTGERAPKLISREQLKTMGKGSVVVDIAIDQGGCLETSRPTTHSNPTYVEEGVVHYCVTNMPGACAKSATLALTHATQAHAVHIVKHGVDTALREDPHLLAGLNVAKGQITHDAVAKAQNLKSVDPLEVI